MELKLYLQSRKLTQKEFSGLIPMSPATFHSYLKGTRKVPLHHAIKIFELTGGKVTMKELLMMGPKKNR